jgi:hypothetical protein
LVEEQEKAIKRNETSRRQVEIFVSNGYENITGKINKFLEENAVEIEKVIDIKPSTSPILSSHDTIDSQMIIVTVLIHYKIRQEVNDRNTG